MKTVCRLMLVIVFCLLLVSCWLENKDLGKAEVTIHWVFTNTSGSNKVLSITVTPSLDNATDTPITVLAATTLASGSNEVKGSYTKHATLSSEIYYPLPRTYHFRATLTDPSGCTVTPSANFSEDVDLYNPVEINYVVSCVASSSVQMKAKHTQDPVRVNLVEKDINNRSDRSWKSVSPLNLIAQNNHESKAALQPKASYRVTVSPRVDSQDRVAHFDKTLTANSKHWTVDYKTGSRQLITGQVLNDSAESSVTVAIKQGVNTVVLNGIDFVYG